MSTYITRGATTITPVLVTGWEAETESQNVIHEILSKATPDVTLRTGATRSGTLTMLFSSEATAMAAFNLHVTAGVTTLVSTELTYANFQYVTNGTVTIALDDVTREQWTVSVPYRAIT